MNITIALHDGWHTIQCPIKQCPGVGEIAGVSLDQLAEHRVEKTPITVTKVFTCKHQHTVELRP